LKDSVKSLGEQWLKTDFGCLEVKIQDEPDSGLTGYMLKGRQKRSRLDSIDWASCQLIAEQSLSQATDRLLIR
jgi:hypothetical protein